MISIMELMEKITPSIKNNGKKKGMTLVEVMAAMAILSILFVGVSSLMINIAKSQGVTERKLESDGYIKNTLLMFETSIVKPKDMLEVTVKFDNLLEMQEGVIASINGNILENIDGKYEINIKCTRNTDFLYRVDVALKNDRSEEYKKYIYVYLGK